MGITGPNELEDAVYFDISMVGKRSKTCGHVSDYHGVIPPAYRVIDPGPGHQRKEKRRIKKSTMGSKAVETIMSSDIDKDVAFYIFVSTAAL
ncbi:hypothetical protein RRG08_029515 [Elysia crispata]|uniref:Uncharacterized protein n=1 Tax=Elysia crispata TaxID=231223 RepID=A0AAE1CNA9_9GAST|nr:hypothetical protein RRG08_029515 [Elysia crispata]